MGLNPPAIDAPDQAVILAIDAPRPDDGSGPPSSDPGGVPLLDRLIANCRRFGFSRVLVVADTPDRLASDLQAQRDGLAAGLRLDLASAPASGGSLGAIRHVQERLSGRFLLVEARSFFDSNWLDLVPGIAPQAGVVAALRQTQDGPAPGGVYLMDRRIVPDLPASGPLEAAIRAGLANGLATGRTQRGAFFDLGLPEELARARQTLSAPRPAVFFDRDGTLNLDTGYPHRPEDLSFLPGAIAAVKRVNDSGAYAFLATNQSGVARGYFDEAAVRGFHAYMQRHLRAAGAHLDDIRFCPDHPEGTVARYARASDWRKPGPGMLTDLMRAWPVDRQSSLVVGDKQSDLDAAQAAGLRGVLYDGGDLDRLLAGYVAGQD